MSGNISISSMIPTEQYYRNTDRYTDGNGIPLTAQRHIFKQTEI